MPLSELAIRALKPKDAPYLVADGGGLGLMVSPSGSKLWRWRYRFNGKQQTLSLGKYPAVSLAEARRERDKARDQVKAGQHPTRQKRAEKLRRIHEGENTFRAVALRWHASREDSLNDKYYRQCLTRMEQHVFPHLGNLPISEITIPDVVRVVERINTAGTAETARRMKQSISQVFRYATHRGLCLHNPASDLRGVLPDKNEKHHACIHPSELPKLLAAMKAYKGSAFTRAALWLLAFTFVRTGELIGARWTEIQRPQAEWHIPAERMKMKRPHVVPLSRQALEVLDELESLTGHREFIFFSGASKSKHMSNNAVLSALSRMRYHKKMTGHGFRTLASTILNEKGYNPDWIERQLAHEDEDKVRSAYNRAEYLTERKKMMQDYADFLEHAGERERRSVRKIGNS